MKVYEGLILHSILSQTTNMGALTIAKTMLSVVFSGRVSEVHVCLDKYMENSIKDSERRLQGQVQLAWYMQLPGQIRPSDRIREKILPMEYSKMNSQISHEGNWNIFSKRLSYLLLVVSAYSMFLT